MLRNENADSIEKDDANEPTDAKEPALPMDRIDPVLPIERMEPRDPIDRIEPVERFESSDPLDIPSPFGPLTSLRSGPYSDPGKQSRDLHSITN